MEKAIESYWAHKIDKAELDQTLTDLHKENLLLQKNYNLDSIPVGDFSLYDHILDTSLLFNIIPERFQGREVNDDLLFDIARGNKEHVASALIKWFNTNYHYIVPEWDNVEPKVEKTHYSNALNTPNLSMLMPIQLSLAQLLSSNFLKVATNHLKRKFKLCFHFIKKY